MQTHISYKTAEKLIKFMGKLAPDPMEGQYWKTVPKIPFYKLHDILSMTFCEAMAKRIGKYRGDIKILKIQARSDCEFLASEFYRNGLGEVEKILICMMED